MWYYMWSDCESEFSSSFRISQLQSRSQQQQSVPARRLLDVFLSLGGDAATQSLGIVDPRRPGFVWGLKLVGCCKLRFWCEQARMKNSVSCASCQSFELLRRAR
mmetsp:Transcript_26200/g.43729  ORF Transcript_26200/g.43729 Transcript_26200/m.43729 type:complete len:104 (+) Transcript_26200:357-668(+)